MQKYINLLNTITKERYIPPKNGSPGEIGDDFECWTCRYLERKLGYQVIDCSSRKTLSSYCSKKKINFRKKIINNSLKGVFSKDVIQDMRKKLDDVYRLKYVCRFEKKRNLIIFQPWFGRTPDILIISGNIIIPIECKTAKDGKYVMGDSIPKDGYRFLFAHLNKNTLKHAWGKDLEYPTKHPKFAKMINDQISRGKRINKEMADYYFNFAGTKVKFFHRERHQFHPSRGII